MQFADDDATTLTEQVMAHIQDHLKREPSPQENFHYNRVYEKVRAVLAAHASPDEGTALDALKQMLESVYDLHGNAEDCEECGVLADAKHADLCAVHSSQKLYAAWLVAERVLGPCVCGHTVDEHDDCDERRCAQGGCDCRFFKLAALRQARPEGQE